MQITVEIKNVYGVERIYAVCNNAKLITKLKQSKTLSKEDISILRPGAQPVFRGPNPEQREGFSFYLDGIREEGGKYYLNYSYKAIT